MKENELTLINNDITINDNLVVKINELVIRSEETDLTNYDNIKKVLVDMRKFTKELDTKRIDVKKQIMADYDALALSLKDTLEPLTSEIGRLSAVQLALEIDEATAKKNDILAKIYENIEMLAIEFKFDPELLIKKEYYNKTYTINKIEQELENVLIEIKRNYENLDDEIRVHYLSHLDLSRALTEKSDRDKINAKLEEMKAESSAVEITAGSVEYALVKIQKSDLKILDEMKIKYEIEGEMTYGK